MPPKTSTALVNRGVSGLANKQKAGGVARTNRHGHGEARAKHTTSLVLRDGPGGVWGTGEVMLKGGHFSGPQKLAARANALITTGLLPPFNFSQLLNIAWSQCDLNLRTVERLVDYHDFYRDMKQALQSRPEVVFAAQGKDKKDFFKDKNFVATQVSARIHNLFFVASAWRMIWTILVHMAELIRDDLPVRQQLDGNDRLRSYFLVLYDCINDVIEIGKQQVSQLVIASPYYSAYFSLNDEGTMEFNAAHIREAHKSLLTTILLEIALTDSKYPLNVLMSSLGDVVADAPKGKHRISQSLWDAVGDLSFAVDFRGQLDAAIVDPAAEFKKWFENAPDYMDGYKKYKEAIVLSEEASLMIDGFKDIIFPLEKTENSQTLQKMWMAINDNYAAVAGKNIEALWLLEGAWEQTPKWNTFFLPQLDEESDPDGSWNDRKRLALHKHAKRRDAPPKPRLMITNTAANDDSDDDLPELLDVSDSSEEDDSDSDEYEEEDEDEESDYDEGDMEALDDLMKEALQANFDTPDDSDIANNPFIRMMKSLKGRFASLDPRSKPTDNTRLPDARMKVRPDKPVFGPPRPPPGEKAEPGKKAPPAPPQPSSTKVTVEEVADEEAGGVSAAKKKKKKKKKKPAKKTDSEALAQGEGAEEAPATPPPSSPTPSPAPTAAKSPQPAADKKKPPAKPAKVNPLIKEYDPSMSLLSLSLGPETARSAHSYLQQQAGEVKTKVKSRPADAPALEKKSLFSRLRRAPDDELDEKRKDEKKTSSRWGMFKGVKRKFGKTLKQIIAPSKDERGKKGMRWEEFERAMVGLGFTIDGTTAGSSVRFTPSNNEPPISFHKPHPDSTIHPVMLLEFSKRLKEKYGWSEEMFESYGDD